MSPIRLSIALAVCPVPALAHPGHLAAAAGHDHWIAGAAIGAAVAIALWGILKGRKDEAEQADADDAVDETPEEAAA